MKLGVYSLVTPDYRVDDAAGLVAETGHEGIEWTVDYKNAVWDGTSRWHIDTANLEESARAARAAAERHGLTVVSLGTAVSCFDLDGARTCMEVARIVGAPMLRVAGPRYDGKTPYQELFEKARAAYVEVEKAARAAGVKALLELHHGLICTNTSSALRLLEGRDPRWVGVILDPANMVREGIENWKMACEILGPYLAHVHTKNDRWVRREDGTWFCEHCGIDEGIVDWKEVIAALKSVGYDGWLNLEDLQGGWACKPVGITTREKLERGHRFLSALLQGE
ncbi:MAG: sugar phosphate isomerase/epimerase [Candidatus Brocadiaceae bacterium]|nr:sugar phosphate isomerase/epimerase [Candidatus Brocadiaceae bacterium]